MLAMGLAVMMGGVLGALGVLARLTAAWALAGVGSVVRLASLAAFCRRVWRLGGVAGAWEVMVVALGRCGQRKAGRNLEGLREVREVGVRVRRNVDKWRLG